MPLEEEEYFIVWAKNKKEALQYVEATQGNTDKSHALFEIIEPGFINFHVTNKSGTVTWAPPKDDLKNGTWINLTDVFASADEEVVFGPNSEDI